MVARNCPLGLNYVQISAGMSMSSLPRYPPEHTFDRAELSTVTGFSSRKRDSRGPLPRGRFTSENEMC